MPKDSTIFNIESKTLKSNTVLNKKQWETFKIALTNSFSRMLKHHIQLKWLIKVSWETKINEKLITYHLSIGLFFFFHFLSNNFTYDVI